MDSKIIFAMMLLWGFCICLVTTNASSFDDAYRSTKLSNSFTASTSCVNTTFSCAGKGDACTGDFSGTSNNCNMTNSSCCAGGLYCISSTCQIDNNGANCSNITQCHGKLFGGPMGCLNGTCQYLYGVGDQCSTNSDCQTVQVNCTNGLCTGLTAGQTCNIAYAQCGWNLYCGLNTTSGATTCVQSTASGGACVVSATCKAGTSCVQGKCTTDFTVASGGACSARSCVTGYYCNAAGTCAQAQTTLTSCTNNTDCSNGTLCVCSLFTGESYCASSSIQPCTDQISNLWSCLTSSNCSTGPRDAPNSCCYSNCYSQFKKSQSCGCSNIKSLTGNCAYNPYCSGFPIWAIIVIIVVAIVLVLAIVLLVFFMMRRRRQYDSI